MINWRFNIEYEINEKTKFKYEMQFIKYNRPNKLGNIVCLIQAGIYISQFENYDLKKPFVKLILTKK